MWETYDSGKTGHWFQCDGGAKLQAAKDSTDKFNQMTVNQRLEFLYREIQRTKEKVGNLPLGDFMIG